MHRIYFFSMESKLDTMKIIFNGRDCRGGKGDRTPFIKAMQHISQKYPELFYNNLDFELKLLEIG